jgi:hypothetical protein
MGQLAMKIKDEPKRFTNEQKKMRYTENRLEGIALNQIQPYIDRKSGNLKLNSLEKLLDLLQLAFGYQHNGATTNREFLKLKMKNRELSLYYTEFQRWVPDLDWNEAAQLEVLTHGLSEELKDSLQHCDFLTDLTEFVKLCSKPDSPIRARVAERRSGRWTAQSKKHETQNNTTCAPEAALAETVADYHGPAPIDLSAVKGRKITPEERKC